MFARVFDKRHHHLRHLCIQRAMPLQRCRSFPRALLQRLHHTSLRRILRLRQLVRFFLCLLPPRRIRHVLIPERHMPQHIAKRANALHKLPLKPLFRERLGDPRQLAFRLFPSRDRLHRRPRRPPLRRVSQLPLHCGHPRRLLPIPLRLRPRAHDPRLALAR